MKSLPHWHPINQIVLLHKCHLFCSCSPSRDLKPRTSRFYARMGWTQKQNHAPQATILSALLVRCISGFGILPIQSQYPNKLARIRALLLHFGPVLRQGTLATCAHYTCVTCQSHHCHEPSFLAACVHMWLCFEQRCTGSACVLVKGSEHGPIHCSF
jgi:hypothetical protein